MSPTDTKKLYTEDKILLKLKSAMAEASGPVTSDIQAAIEERKKELRNN
ncbi:hypothetical protein [Haloarcula montana]|nr:hypothetical protein [Haloarcula sp. GH36]